MGNSLQPHGGQAIQENPDRRQPQEDHQHIQNNDVKNQATTELTWELCTEPFSADKSFNNNNKCSHPFCLDCIAKYIQVKLEDNASNIPCPALNCKQLLDPLFCSQYISKPVFVKWCDLLCDSAVLCVEQRCYCPNRNCTALVLNECKAVEKAQCPNCKKDFCFKCQVPWHAGFRCNESGRPRDANDVLFGELLERRRWPRCPKCGQCVERNGGCMFIRCRCKAIFCYHCGKAHMGPCKSSSKSCLLHAVLLFVVYFILVAFIALEVDVLMKYM